MSPSVYNYPLEVSQMSPRIKRRSKMCLCGTRAFLLLICFVQLISSIERQVFDFLGQMWGPIIFNFWSTIVTLIGIFGVIYKRPRHLTMLTLWQLISLAWNCFLIVLYTETGPFKLDQSSELLNLGTGSRSWWETNGPNCIPRFNESHPDFSFYDLKPISVDGCLFPFYAIETIQAGIHFILSLFCLILSSLTLCSAIRAENETLQQFSGAVSSIANHYNMSYNPHPNNSIPRRGAAHRRSTNSLPGRRSLRRTQQNRSRSSTRSTASGRRKRRREQLQQSTSNATHRSLDRGQSSNQAESMYHSQNHLLANQNHFDVSSLDSFNPAANPIYSGSVHSAGSRFSLYTINPQSTMETIRVNPDNQSSHFRRGRRGSPIYMNSSETVM